MNGSTGFEQYVTMEKYLKGRRCIISPVGRLAKSLRPLSPRAAGSPFW